MPYINGKYSGDNKFISIVIPTYNSSKYLETCLKSIRNQTYKDIELIVVDGNSNDGTKDISKKYADKVFNKGVERSVKRNCGAKNSQGKYVLFIDSDMILSEDVVKECVDKITANVRIKGIVIPEESFGEGFWSQCKKLERSFYVGVEWMEAARFFPKSIFDEIGGYDEKNTGAEDYDFPQRIKDKYGKDSISNIKAYIRHDEGRLAILEILKKKFYYARGFDIYKKKRANREYFKKQSSIILRYRLFLSNPKKIWQNSLVGFGMFFMKTCEFIAAGLGSLVYKFLAKKKCS